MCHGASASRPAASVWRLAHDGAYFRRLMQFFAMSPLTLLATYLTPLAFRKPIVLLISVRRKPRVLAANYAVTARYWQLVRCLWQKASIVNQSWCPRRELLFIGRLLSGVGSATFSTCNAYIADRTSSEERAQYFGMMGAAFGLGFVIGPVLGGFLGEFGPRVPFFVTAAMVLLNLLLGLVLLPESLPKTSRRPFEWQRANPLSALLSMRQFRLAYLMIGVLFFYNMGHHVLPAIWNFWGIERFDWTPKEVGYSLGYVGILMVLTQGLLIRWAIPRFGHVAAGWIGLLSNIVAFIGYAVAPSVFMVYVCLTIGAIGGLAGPAMNGLASIQVGERQQGELQGAIGSMASLTSIISPLAMTMTFEHFSAEGTQIYFPGAPFLLAAALTGVSLVLFLAATRNQKRLS